MTKHYLKHEIDRGFKKSGVKVIIIHDPLHSHAALMVELGYPIVAAAECLGDTVEVAMATYSHLYPNKTQTVAANLDRQACEEPVTAPAPADLSTLPDQLETAQKEAQK